MTRPTITLLLLLLVATAVMATEYPVRNVVPDRPLTDKEQIFLASVPDVHPGSGALGLRDVVKVQLLTGVSHVPQGGKFVPNTSWMYWERWQLMTRAMVVDVPTPKPPAPQIVAPRPAPAPAFTPTLIRPATPQVATYFGEKSDTAGSSAIAWWPVSQAPPREETCPPFGPAPADPEVPTPMDLPPCQ